MQGASRQPPLRLLTAVPICDGHDSAINTLNLEFVRHGVAVVHPGYHRSARDIARAAVQEDARANRPPTGAPAHRGRTGLATGPGLDRTAARIRRGRIGGSGLSLGKEEFRAALQCDPIRAAPPVDRNRVLPVLGRLDTMAPFRGGWERCERMGRPRTLVLPAGHLSALLEAPHVRAQAVKFFRQQPAAASRDETSFE